MKLIMAIINRDDTRSVLDRLASGGFSATVTSSTGGFLRTGNTTIFCGVDDTQVDEVLDIFRASFPKRDGNATPQPPASPTPTTLVAGAIVFVLTIEQFSKV